MAALVHQPTLLGSVGPARNPHASVERIQLDAASWVDVVREWWLGADQVLDALLATVAWRQGRRRMWNRMVDDPRLSYWCGPGRLPHPGLAEMQTALSAHYGKRLRPPGLNYYRDGQDSVAWHADRELRVLDDTIVAIVTFGTRRPFLIRSMGGGPSTDLAPGSGDLLVMGGATQRDWQHAVPKTSRAGPRVSASWRWTPVRPAIRDGVHPWLGTSTEQTWSRAASVP